jgi:hypothetical protein
MEESLQSSLGADLASMFFLLAIIVFGIRRYPLSPRMAFLSAWCMRIFMALFFSYLANVVCDQQRPIPLLVAITLLLLFLIESVKLWIFTNMLSQIDIPIFPKFSQCDENFIWPMGEVFDSARRAIFAYGFNEKALLKVGNEKLFAARSPVFYSDDRRSRLQVIFDSFSGSRSFVNCILTSFTTDGSAVVTNNLQTIFASFYPQSWDVKRYPMAPLEYILKTHSARIMGKDTVEMSTDSSWNSINTEYHQIELANCNFGLCEKLGDNDHITLTFAGRYRLWVDLLNYAYLGRAS